MGPATGKHQAPAGDHKAARTRPDSITRQTCNFNNRKDPQKKHHLGTVSKIIYCRAFTCSAISNSPLVLMLIKRHLSVTGGGGGGGVLNAFYQFKTFTSLLEGIFRWGKYYSSYFVEVVINRCV